MNLDMNSDQPFIHRGETWDKVSKSPANYELAREFALLRMAAVADVAVCLSFAALSYPPAFYEDVPQLGRGNIPIEGPYVPDAYPYIVVHYSFAVIVIIESNSLGGLLLSFHWSVVFRGEFQAHSHNPNLMSRELDSASHIGSQLAGCYTAIQKGHEQAVCQLEYRKEQGSETLACMQYPTLHTYARLYLINNEKFNSILKVF